MSSEIDPEGRETQALFAAADFRDARVLEIGCGAGRLTRRYAPVARFVAGLDPAADTVSTARRERPEEMRSRLVYVQGGAAALPFAGRAFDVVLFGWSL